MISEVWVSVKNIPKSLQNVSENQKRSETIRNTVLE
jgi:hypothetical protein